MKKKFTSRLQRLDSNIWGLYFDIPKEVSEYFMKKGVKRFLYTLDNKKTIPRAMSPHGDSSYFLYVNKPLMKEFRWPIGSEIEIEMEEDTSEFGMPMPEELTEAFSFYPDARAYFERLTPGRQRNLIYMVDKPKRIETRVKKAIQIVEYLEHSAGQLDFKELNEWFKERNRM